MAEEKEKINSEPRYKIVNGKRRYLCDYEGKCKNIAYVEVYPSLMGKKYKDSGWSYLCKKHFEQEKKRFKEKLPYCYVDNKKK